jgi:hypothetical protein
MINERDIASGFSSVWSQAFPMLTPNFMKEFNASKIIKLKNNISTKPTGHPDVIAELSFILAKICHEKKIPLESVKGNQKILTDAFKLTLNSIQRSTSFFNLPNELSEKELNEAVLITTNINSFIKSWKSKSIHFAPKLSGYGVLNECHADISIDDSLFEIKTVTRPFRSKDLKQLFIYLALQSASPNKKWNNAGLYNPRLGHYCKFNVENLVKNLSGYDSSREAFSTLLELLVRDVQIETNF